MKILVATQLQESGLAYLRAKPGVELAILPFPDRATFLEAMQDVDAVIVRSQVRVDAEALDQASRLKVIGRAGIGVDNIDLERATQQGVLVVNAPRDNIDSAAEHTLALLLAVVRQIPAMDRALKEGRWEKEALGRELRGKRLGVLGFGKVGMRVARMARALEMEVVAYDPYVAAEQFRQAGVRRSASAEEVLAEADVVSIHLPGLPGSGPFLDRGRLLRMKPGAILLNTSRGALVDEQALFELLQAGRLWGAGLDVWSNEPAAGLPLQRLPNVVATPHMGASTVEAQERVAATIAAQVWKALIEEPVDFPVNLPFVEAELASRIKPWTVLAEKMGSLLAQILETSPDALELTYGGELAETKAERVRAAMLKGFLARVTDEKVNFVNAETLAKEHGIEVHERHEPVRASYVATLQGRVRSRGRSVSVTGTLFDGERPRIVELDGFELELALEENLLLMRWWDRPGVLGLVGTALGEAGVNIASAELSRSRAGENALAVISTDTPVSPEIAEKLAALDSVIGVRAVRLG